MGHVSVMRALEMSELEFISGGNDPGDPGVYAQAMKAMEEAMKAQQAALAAQQAAQAQQAAAQIQWVLKFNVQVAAGTNIPVGPGVNGTGTVEGCASNAGLCK